MTLGSPIVKTVTEETFSYKVFNSLFAFLEVLVECGSLHQNLEHLVHLI